MIYVHRWRHEFVGKFVVIYGLFIGDIYLGNPTCADDIIMLNDSLSNAVSMLSSITDYANNHFYTLHPQKSVMITYNVNEEMLDLIKENNPLTINGDEINITDMLTHLGLDRYSKETKMCNLVQSRINLARRTTYSLFGAGLHGINGLPALVNLHLYRIYVIPRMLYGLDAVNLSKAQIDELEKYHKNFLRRIQHLPERVASCAVYLLLGELPITAYLHKRVLSLFGIISRNPGTPIYDLAVRQLAVKGSSSNSWFIYVSKLFIQYNLGNPINVLEYPLSKEEWKKSVKKGIEDYHFQLLKEDHECKSSLRMLIIDDVKTHHSVWENLRTDEHSCKTSTIKARFITNTYLLQANQARFGMSASGSCPLCDDGSEDRTHFLLACKATDNLKAYFLPKVLEYIPKNIHLSIEAEDDVELLMKLICNPASEIYGLGRNNAKEVELLSRNWIFEIHKFRARSLHYRW